MRLLYNTFISLFFSVCVCVVNVTKFRRQSGRKFKANAGSKATKSLAIYRWPIPEPKHLTVSRVDIYLRRMEAGWKSSSFTSKFYTSDFIFPAHAVCFSFFTSTGENNITVNLRTPWNMLIHIYKPACLPKFCDSSLYHCYYYYDYDLKIWEISVQNFDIFHEWGEKKKSKFPFPFFLFAFV